MKKLFRSAKALSPSLSLAAPLFLYALLFALNSLFPSLFCMPINPPDGKEFICGSEYSHFSMNLLRLLALSSWVLLLVTGGVELFGRRVTRVGVVAWSVSALLFAGLVVLWLNLPVEGCP